MQLGKGYKSMGMGFASEWVRGKAHGVRSIFSAVSGAVDLIAIERDSQAVQTSQMTEEELVKHSLAMTHKVSIIILSSNRFPIAQISSVVGPSSAQGLAHMSEDVTHVERHSKQMTNSFCADVIVAVEAERFGH